jgi:hypothetical protein
VLQRKQDLLLGELRSLRRFRLLAPQGPGRQLTPASKQTRNSGITSVVPG